MSTSHQRLLILTAAAAFVFLFAPSDAQAACGGDGEVVCLSGCDSGHRSYLGICWDLEAQGFPSYCGGSYEPTCGIGIRTAWGLPGPCKSGRRAHVTTCYPTDGSGYPTFCGGNNEPICDAGFQLAWGINDCKSGRRDWLGTCYPLESEGFPDFCGGVNEPACDAAMQLAWGIDSCKSTNYEEAGFPLGTCRALDTDGFPPYCGGNTEDACDVTLQSQLGINACKDDHYEEVGFPLGTCHALDGDGYPVSCGDLDELACTVDQITSTTLATGIPILSCKWGYSSDSLIGGTCRAFDSDGWPEYCGGEGEPPCSPLQYAWACKAGLGVLGTVPNWTCQQRVEFTDMEDFSRPAPQSWGAAEAPPGPRTVFYVHGKGGQISAGSAGEVVEELAALGHTIYAADYNAGAQDGAVPFELHKAEPHSVSLDDDPDGIDWKFASHASYGARTYDGVAFLLQDVAADLASAIDAVGGAEVTIVAGSMGGLVARHLVFRHYDELRNAGHRITEVITLGTPHTGGGFGVPGATFGALDIAGRTIQESYGCTLYPNASDPAQQRDTYQICLMEKWQRGREEAGVAIDDSDYPHIRWVTVAGRNQLLTTHRADEATPYDSDTRVAIESAFGIAQDECFPHSHAPSPSRVVTGSRDVESTPARTATCHHGSHPAGDLGYDHDGLEDVETDHSFDDAVTAEYVAYQVSQDVDDDGVADTFGRNFELPDNCTELPNAPQRDTDGDGYGNACDADYNGDLVVGGPDFAMLLPAFGSAAGDANWNADIDADGDGLIGAADFSAFIEGFRRQAPGPSSQD